MASAENQTRKRLKNGTINAKPNKTVVTGMQNELRTQIMVLLNERTASRPEICKELGASANRVRHEIKVLLSLSPPLVEQVFERPVRGTVEKFFRATAEPYLNPSEWPGVPDAIKGGMRGTLLNMIVEDAVAGVSGGTYDSLEDAHMSWIPMILDEQGWEEIAAILFRTMQEAIKVKKDSAERLIKEDAEGVSCTVSILGYPSANENRKVGPSIDADKDIAPTERASLAARKSPSRKTGTKKAKAAGKAATKSKRRKGAGK